MHDLSNLVQTEVTRGATMALQLTNLVSIFSEHKADSKTFMHEARETLASISEQVTKTNGRVNGHDREIKELKDTVSRAMWWALGVNGSVIVGVIVWWLTKQ